MTINYKNKKLLVIAPHPDDEVLGCGGLISKVKAGGGNVHVLCFTVGNIKQYEFLEIKFDFFKYFHL